MFQNKSTKGQGRGKSMVSCLAVLVISVSSLVTGCASFPDYKIPKVESITVNKESIQSKPTIYMPIKFMSNLSSGDEKSNVESAAPLPTLRRIIDKIANELAIFKAFSFESFQAKNMDFVLQIEMLNYGSKGKAMGAGFITGLTLFVIPSAATDNYKLTAKLYDKNGDIIKTFAYEDAISTWFGIWLLPMAGNTPQDAVEELWENMFKALFRDLIKDNALLNP